MAVKVKLVKPDAYFIAVPYTGESTVLDNWLDDRVSFEVSQDIRFTFGFVRHPLDRFVSVYKDLNLEGVSIEHFIDKAIYEKDWYSSPSISLSTVPFSHPVNMLHEANYIGRYENFRKDFEAIKAHIGLTCETDYASINNSTSNWEEILSTLDDEYLNRLLGYYHQDFKTFNYEIPYSLSRTESY